MTGQPPNTKPGTDAPFEDRFTFYIDEQAEANGSVIKTLAELLVDLWEDEQRKEATTSKDDTHGNG